MNTRSRNILLACAVTIGIVAALSFGGSHRSSPPVPAPLPSASASYAKGFSPAGRAKVRVYDDGVRAPDRWVIFHDAEGAITEAVKTGADGSASGGVGPGSMITIVDASSVKRLLTIRDVEPDDDILVGEEEDEG